MNKLAALLTIGLALAPAWGQQDTFWHPSGASPLSGNPDMQRQEIIMLEREAARAIQLNDRTFFARVYADDFTGVLSHGQPVDKGGLIDVVQTQGISYQSFVASDIKIRLYEQTAVATCLWSWRATIKGQSVSSVMRVIHVYVNTTRGWKVVAGQATPLPPNIQQPL
ncbi:MAG TPA: nuclear transport factor 2 family protein [Candidatus Acidoferrales bacterium]|nr:nuclear transport factor 2 family protein [Candidatus Acidoferrales bacterium]